MLFIDVNECAVRNECSPHAECINNEGSFVCRCLSGYVGDGRQCRTAEESGIFTQVFEENLHLAKFSLFFQKVLVRW